MRILLTDEDFKKLVKGEVVKKDGNEIALSDIGWSRMVDHVHEGMKEKSNFTETYY